MPVGNATAEGENAAPAGGGGLPAGGAKRPGCLTEAAASRQWKLVQQLARQQEAENPDNPEPSLWAAVAVQHLSGAPAARPTWEAAARRFPRCTAILLGLSNARADTGDPEGAAAALDALLEIDPGHADAMNNKGLLCEKHGDPKAASAWFRRAMVADPECWGAMRNLAGILLTARAYPEAESLLVRATELAPDDPDAWYLLGQLYNLVLRFDEAKTALRKAVDIRPDFAGAWTSLSYTLREQHAYREALTAAERGMEIDPTPANQSEYADLLMRIGLHTQAAAAFRRVVALDGRSVRARWGNAIAQLPIVYESEAEIDLARRRYRRYLERLAADVCLDTPADIEEAFAGITNWTPFFLGYQGRETRSLQATFGELLSRITAARFPEAAAPFTPPPLAPGEPLRVGVVSRYFHNHTVWKLFICGWMSHFDRRRARLTAYAMAHRKDEITEQTAQRFDDFVPFDGIIDRTVAAICRDRPHVLLFPEIGMHPATYALASLRLAPLQCVTWGHPITTGLPSIDCFFSSALMEPPDGAAHYTEEMVPLPGLSICYHPLRVREQRPRRAYYSLPEDAVLYQCSQSLFKYLPQHDEIFAKIAREVPRARFAFLRSHSPVMTERFHRRLGKAFARHGLDVARHVVFLPPLAQGAYLAMNGVMDVYLDSLEWSGGNTSLEALDWGLPMVTLPGAFMRGRHTTAILRQVGVEETIARDEADYVEIAVTLGQDTAYRSRTAEAMASGRVLAYGATAPIRALEDFLEVRLRGKGGL